MVLTEENFRRFAISNLLPLRGIEARPGSTTKQFAATVFWGTTYLQIVIGHNSCHYKRLLFFPGGPFKDSHNLSSFMDQAGMSTTLSLYYKNPGHTKVIPTAQSLTKPLVRVT